MWWLQQKLKYKIMIQMNDINYKTPIALLMACFIVGSARAYTVYSNPISDMAKDKTCSTCYMHSAAYKASLSDPNTRYRKSMIIPPIETQLANAKKAKKAVFVVVTGNVAAANERAMAIAKDAIKIYKNAVIADMKRDDPANANWVSEWRLSGAPLPLILVISPSGQLSGGMIADQASALGLAELVPSPKLEVVYDAVANNKHTIIAFTKKEDRQKVIEECKKAVALLKGKAIFLEVDMADPAEMSFMKKLGINPQTATGSVTVVVNQKGQLAGTSTTTPDAVKLAAAAEKPVKQGCGPGCGPAGCGK